MKTLAARRVGLLMLVCGLAAIGWAQGGEWRKSRQALVVTTPDWAAVDGALQRYERRRGGAWRKIGAAVPVVVGRAGLAWGRGLVDFAAAGPSKLEGDGKAPAGLFRLGQAFGYAPNAPGVRLPYQHMTPAFECVDDGNSKYYNLILDGAKVSPKDWGSSEQMRREDEQYRWGVFVEHNYGPQRQPQGGSCIFLHIWLGAGQGTAGCTAMEQAALEDILRWLRPASRPVLLQLPEAMLQRAKQAERWLEFLPG
jgi:D-alanyl-D-alanine dipeptidase